MTTDNDAPNDDSGAGTQPEQEPDHIKDLRAKAKRASELETQLAEYQRKDAFRDAGIDPTDPQQKYFMRGYDGELTPEAIRTEAIQAGYLTDPEAQQKGQELAGHDRMDAAAAGTQGQVPKDPDLNAMIANAKDETEVLKILAQHRPELVAPIE